MTVRELRTLLESCPDNARVSFIYTACGDEGQGSEYDCDLNTVDASKWNGNPYTSSVEIR